MAPAEAALSGSSRILWAELAARLKARPFKAKPFAAHSTP